MEDTPEVSVAEAMSGRRSNMKALKILYSTKEEFKFTAANIHGIIDSFKLRENSSRMEVKKTSMNDFKVGET